MKILFKFYLFLLFFYIFHFSEKTETSDDIIKNSLKENIVGYQCKEILEEYRKNFSSVKSFILTDSNYNDYLNQHNKILIYIHSACTKESIDFIPVIKFVSEYFNNKKDSNLPKIATLEISDDNNNKNNQYNFRSLYYPIIVLKIKGIKRFIPYTGYYNAHSIITFLTKYSNDLIIKMNNTDILNQLLTPQLTSLSIIFFRKQYIKPLIELSKSLSYGLIGDCSNKTQKICEKIFNENIYNYSDIALIKNIHIESDFEECSDNKKKILEEDKKPEIVAYNYTNFRKFREFVVLNALPKIFNFTKYNYDLMIKSAVNTIIYIKGKEEKKNNSEISKILKKAIYLNNSKIKIGGILEPLTNKNEKLLMDDFRLEEEDFTTHGNVVIQNFQRGEQNLYRINMQQILIDKEINEKNILEFASSFNQGLLKPELKSENRPKVHPKENLRMVVARTFDEEIKNNNKIAIVLCLLTMNLTNLKEHEKLIDLLTDKLDAFNSSLIFGYMDVGFNYFENIPKYNPSKTPYYRYYYRNKSEGYNDFKGNYSNIQEIEEWITDNYGKENGEGFKDLMKKYIQTVNEQMKEEEEEKKRKEQQFEKDIEAGNITSFEMVLGDGSNESINITEKKMKRIIEKKIEAEERKKKEEQLRNKTENNNQKGIIDDEKNKETDL